MSRTPPNAAASSFPLVNSFGYVFFSNPQLHIILSTSVHRAPSVLLMAINSHFCSFYIGSEEAVAAIHQIRDSFPCVKIKGSSLVSLKLKISSLSSGYELRLLFHSIMIEPFQTQERLDKIWSCLPNDRVDVRLVRDEKWGDCKPSILLGVFSQC